MTVTRVDSVTWTCDMVGCEAKYEGPSPIGGIPDGFVTIRVEPSSFEPMHRAGGVYCARHSQVLVGLLRTRGT